MAVYDLAYRLAKSIKESDEYTNYLKLREKILADEKSKEMLLNYQKQQIELQAKQFSGQEITEEEKEKLSGLSEIINLNHKVKEYQEAEYRVSVLISDIQRILFSDLELGVSEEKKHSAE